MSRRGLHALALGASIACGPSGSSGVDTIEVSRDVRDTTRATTDDVQRLDRALELSTAAMTWQVHDEAGLG